MERACGVLVLTEQYNPALAALDKVKASMPRSPGIIIYVLSSSTSTRCISQHWKVMSDFWHQVRGNTRMKSSRRGNVCGLSRRN